jgi:hypothetical protein
MTYEPDYADYDDYDPRNDPVVILEQKVQAILTESEDLVKWTAQNRMLVFGALPDIHEAYTNLGLVLSQFRGVLPAQAAE